MPSSIAQKQLAVYQQQQHQQQRRSGTSLSISKLAGGSFSNSGNTFYKGHSNKHFNNNLNNNFGFQQSTNAYRNSFLKQKQNSNQQSNTNTNNLRFTPDIQLLNHEDQSWDQQRDRGVSSIIQRSNPISMMHINQFEPSIAKTSHVQTKGSFTKSVLKDVLLKESTGRYSALNGRIDELKRFESPIRKQNKSKATSSKRELYSNVPETLLQNNMARRSHIKEKSFYQNSLQQSIRKNEILNHSLIRADSTMQPAQPSSSQQSSQQQQMLQTVLHHQPPSHTNSFFVSDKKTNLTNVKKQQQKQQQKNNISLASMEKYTQVKIQQPGSVTAGGSQQQMRAPQKQPRRQILELSGGQVGGLLQNQNQSQQNSSVMIINQNSDQQRSICHKFVKVPNNSSILAPRPLSALHQALFDVNINETDRYQYPSRHLTNGNTANRIPGNQENQIFFNDEQGGAAQSAQDISQQNITVSHRSPITYSDKRANSKLMLNQVSEENALRAAKILPQKPKFITQKKLQVTGNKVPISKLQYNRNEEIKEIKSRSSSSFEGNISENGEDIKAIETLSSSQISISNNNTNLQVCQDGPKLSSLKTQLQKVQNAKIQQQKGNAQCIKSPQEQFRMRSDDTLPSRQGLAKPFFRQVPLSEYEEQIRQMRDVFHISNTLPQYKALRVKTIKQYVAMCQKIMRERLAKKRKRANLNEDLMDVGVTKNEASLTEQQREEIEEGSDLVNAIDQTKVYVSQDEEELQTLTIPPPQLLENLHLANNTNTSSHNVILPTGSVVVKTNEDMPKVHHNNNVNLRQASLTKLFSVQLMQQSPNQQHEYQQASNYHQVQPLQANYSSFQLTANGMKQTDSLDNEHEQLSTITIVPTPTPDAIVQQVQQLPPSLKQKSFSQHHPSSNYPQLKPNEIVQAEKMKKQVEDYIKKRIEHLEVMRDQVERVHQVRLEKQLSIVTDRMQQKNNSVIQKEKKKKALHYLQALLRGHLARKEVLAKRKEMADLDMSVASKLADSCLTHMQTMYHASSHLAEIIAIQKAFRRWLYKKRGC